ncbi:secretory phospholipase A2 receptor isoform X1 [Acipenser ruthenus]|uniref:secretory phospholipase A2 receptor isoform X1 n=1 Tax=Acipenser ruthenus TaxID=7906 RepID=UPI0027420FFA|nr:secretory phospholipase A2 receptor isoform X1 [Acipenser ruthenus]
MKKICSICPIRVNLRAVGVLAAVLTFLFVKSCNSAADEDAALDQTQISELYTKGVFILESEHLNRCIRADKTKLTLENCDQPSKHMLWKWVSRHRLFNIGSSMCLGLNTTSLQQPLNMFKCDSTLKTLWWRCSGNTLFGAAQLKLTGKGRLVVATKQRVSSQRWKIYLTSGEGPCAHPYEEIHTVQGNAHGMPCVLPFKYNNKWYSECTTEGREDNYRWCATTSLYDQDEKWGFCPNPETDCDVFWEEYPDTKACYQFNLQSILSWSEAHASCQAQDGNLLSITDLTEQRYISERLNDVGVLVWTGLNHLDESAGWQWSDGAPLALVNLTRSLSPMSALASTHCGVFNSAVGNEWQNLDCGSGLPFICKKYPNFTRRAEPFDTWQYYPTVCSPGWFPHNKFCYKLQSQEQSWKDSLTVCRSSNADLISVHSLADVELLLTLFQNVSETVSGAWIGLTNKTQGSFEWSDGSPVTFTYWHKYEPNVTYVEGPLCVRVTTDSTWQVKTCDERLPSVCKKPGNLEEQKSGLGDTGCSEGWKRRGHFCYKVTGHLQNYEDATKSYYCNSPLVTVGNRFEQAFINSLIQNVTNGSSLYFWTALQDRNKTGEYSWLTQKGSFQHVRYTNWNKYQPASSGGCVAISGGKYLGRWEVKDCNTFRAMSICKQAISSYKETESSDITINQQASCAPGWESKPDLLYCYKVFHREKVLMKRSWEDADFFCQALGSNLVSFSHYEEENFLNGILQNMFNSSEERLFWAGFNKRNPLSGAAWEWSDGTAVVSSFIEDRNNEDDQRNCAAYKAGNMIIPLRCDAKLEWICKMPKGAKLKGLYWYTEQNEPWVFYQKSEYLFHNISFPWNAVAFACKMLGADLVSIHSSDQLDFIQSKIEKLFQNEVKWWIGLFAEYSNTELRWIDGSAVDYENWEGTNSRRSEVKNERCVYMSSQTGRWSEGKCNGHHPYICERKTVSVVEIPREPHLIGGCPERWLYFGHKCFLMHVPNNPQDLKNWNDAQAFCKSHEGSLVSVENEIEQAYLTMLLLGSQTSVWIGLQNDNRQKWVNGKPVTYANWSPIEPENSFSDGDDLNASNAQQDDPLCTLLSNNHNYHLTGKWYNEKCLDNGYGFICQKQQDPSKPPSHQSFFHPLPNTIEYGNRSYRIIHGNMTWYEALNKCLENETELVSITDEFHQAFLTVVVNRLDHAHWIGLYSQDQDGINYQWSDGSDAFFTHWDDADEVHLLGDCVYMDINGNWKSADCETPLQGAVCHVPPESKPISYKGECPKTWLKFQSSCYSFEPVIRRLDLEESREYCKQKANMSDVLTIKDEEEHRFVLEELQSFGPSHQTIWLGIIFDTDNDTLEWFDGSPIKYSNWFFKAPHLDPLTIDSCVSMRPSDGSWHLSHCEEKLGFICKIHGDISSDVEVEPLRGASHQGMIPVAVSVAVVIFAVLVTSLWCLYKRNPAIFRRLSSFGNVYYRQASSEAADSEGNILITDLDVNTVN